MDLPEYFNLIKDEKVRKEIWDKLQNETVPKSDFTKFGQTKADELKATQDQLTAQTDQNKKFSDWYYATYEPWVKTIQPILDNHQATQQTHNAIPAANNNNGNDPYANWGDLGPIEQAKLMTEQIVGQLGNQFQTQFQNYTTTMNTSLAAKEKYYQDYIGLYVDANEKKRNDPELDIPKYMQRALGLPKENPMDVAYTLETLERDKKKWMDEGRALGRTDLETEMAEKAKGNIPTFEAGPTVYNKPAPVTHNDRQGELKNKVTEKFGVNVWAP